MFEKEVVIDAKGHMLGRLASVIAKELLNGQRVTIVRAEETNISGSLYRNKVLWERFLKKKMATNPTRGGPVHQRAPSKMVIRAVRGMIPHKSARGAAALRRLRVHEGVPHPFDRKKKLVVPQALRNLRLKPGRAYCRLGDLATLAGWKHDNLIQRLESKRLTKANAYYQSKKEVTKLRAQAVASTAKELKATNAALAKLGY